MTEETTEQPSAIDALVAMDLRLAGLTAAVEGFAKRQQELHGRDYSPELGAIQANWERARDAFDRVIKQPALQLTPEKLASQIEQAGASLREADHDALDHARRDLREAVGTIGSVVASARTARDQNRWIAGAAAAAMVVGFLLGAIVPDIIDRVAPESWHWPEERAAAILGRDGWSSGLRLLQDPNLGKWRALQQAAILARRNADALEKCSKDASKQRRDVKCTVRVPNPITSNPQEPMPSRRIRRFSRTTSRRAA